MDPQLCFTEFAGELSEDETTLLNFQMEIATASNLALCGFNSHTMTMPWAASHQQPCILSSENNKKSTATFGRLNELELWSNRLLRILTSKTGPLVVDKPLLGLLERFARFLISEIAASGFRGGERRIHDCIAALQTMFDATRYRSFATPVAHPKATPWVRNIMPYTGAKIEQRLLTSQMDQKNMMPQCLMVDWARALWLARQNNHDSDNGGGGGGGVEMGNLYPWVEFYDCENDRWLVGRVMEMLLPEARDYIHCDIDDGASQDRLDEGIVWHNLMKIEWSRRLWSSLELQLHHASYDGCSGAPPSSYRIKRRAQPILLIQPIVTANLGPRFVLLSCATPLTHTVTITGTTTREAEQLHAPLHAAIRIGMLRKTYTPLQCFVERLWTKLASVPPFKNQSMEDILREEKWRQELDVGSRVDMLPKGESSWFSATITKKLVDMVLVQADLTLDGRRLSTTEPEWLPSWSHRIAPHGQWRNYLAIGHEVDFFDNSVNRWYPAHIVKTAVCFVQLQNNYNSAIDWVSRWSPQIARAHSMKHFYRQPLDLSSLPPPAQELFAHTHFSTFLNNRRHLSKKSQQTWDLLDSYSSSTATKVALWNDEGIYELDRPADWRPSEDSRLWLWLINVFGQHHGFSILCRVLKEVTLPVTSVLSILELVRRLTPRLALDFACGFLPSFVRLVVSALLRSCNNQHGQLVGQHGGCQTINIRQVMVALREVGSCYDPFDLNDALRCDVYRLPFQMAMLTSAANIIPQEITSLIFEYFFTSSKAANAPISRVPHGKNYWEHLWQCLQCTYQNNSFNDNVCHLCRSPRFRVPPLPPPLPLDPSASSSASSSSLMGALARLSHTLDDLKSTPTTTAATAAEARLPQHQVDLLEPSTSVVCKECTSIIANPLRRHVLLCGVCSNVQIL